MGMYDTIYFSEGEKLTCPHCLKKGVSGDAQIKCFGVDSDGFGSGSLDSFSFPDVVLPSQCSQQNMSFSGVASCDLCNSLVGVHFKMRDGLIYYAAIKKKDEKGFHFKKYINPSKELKENIIKKNEYYDKLRDHKVLLEAIVYAIANRDILDKESAKAIDEISGLGFYKKHTEKGVCEPEDLFFVIKNIYNKLIKR